MQAGMTGKESKDNRRVLVMVGRVFAAVGLALLISSVWFARNQQRIIQTWRRAEAQVVRSRVTSSTSYERNRGANVTTYLAVIEFHYNVDGKFFDTPASSRISTSNYASVKRQVDTYAPGTFHTILYNPKDPNDIRFDAGYTWGFFFLPLLFGGMGVIFGGVGFTLSFLSRSVPVVRCTSCGAIAETRQKFCSNCAATLPLRM
jgi:hypothetical protein